MYGVAKRKSSGKGNKKYKHKVFDWYNLDTDKQESLTIYEMHKKHGMNRAHWTSVATGYRNTLGGWTLHQRRKKHNRGLRGKQFNFVNRDGRKFTGTQKKFCDKFNVNYASGTRICRNKSVTRCGWRLDGVDDRMHFYGKDGHPVKKNTGNVFIFKKGKKEIRGTRQYLADFFNTKPENISASISAAKKGKSYGYKGWAYVGIKNETL
jgi:hypothetical protein